MQPMAVLRTEIDSWSTVDCWSLLNASLVVTGLGSALIRNRACASEHERVRGSGHGGFGGDGEVSDPAKIPRHPAVASNG